MKKELESMTKWLWKTWGCTPLELLLLAWALILFAVTFAPWFMVSPWWQL